MDSLDMFAQSCMAYEQDNKVKLIELSEDTFKRVEKWSKENDTTIEKFIEKNLDLISY